MLDDRCSSSSGAPILGSIPAVESRSGKPCVWWLLYRRDGQLAGAAIIEAPSLYHARMTAAVQGIGTVAEYTDGNEIDAEHATLIPRELIGKMLSPEQVRELAALLGRSDDPDWK
jgi:hypothetical protein